MLKFDNVTKRYGTFQALSNFNLTIADGELFGILGPNGAGKTTAMKIAAGLIRSNHGDVLVGKHSISTDALNAKRITGFIPDTPFIYESLTGREFMHFCAGLYDLDPTFTKERIDNLFDMFQIGNWSDKRSGEYSHGMRQRVVLASAFIHNPKVILIDEPMVGLDPFGVKLIKDVLINFCQEGGSVFLSTHTLSHAEEICHRVGIVSRSELVACGSINEIKSDMNRLEDAFLMITNQESL